MIIFPAIAPALCLGVARGLVEVCGVLLRAARLSPPPPGYRGTYAI
jgi:hypothetical protein